MSTEESRNFGIEITGNYGERQGDGDMGRSLIEIPKTWMSMYSRIARLAIEDSVN